MQAGKFQKFQVNFNSGELTPLLDGRVDVEKYSTGCRQLQNMIVETYGLARRRPGTQFIGEAYDGTGVVRLHDFSFSTTTNYILEFQDLHLGFFTNGGRLQSGGLPYVITTPYTEAQIFDLQFVQVNDICYIFHPAHPIYKLVRVAETNWTLTEVQWTKPAFLDENLTSTTITPSAVSGNITLTASSSIFEAGNVGGYYEITHYKEADTVEVAITGNGFSSNIEVKGAWTLRTFGTWAATLELQRSEDNGSTWETVRSYSGKSDLNLEVDGEQEEIALYRIEIKDWTVASGSPGPRAVLEAPDAFVSGVVKVTGYTSGTVVSATVVSRLFDTVATPDWAEGAWSTRRGFPVAGTFFEQRLVVAGTTNQPQTVWFSASGDFENFEYGTKDADPFTYTIGAQERNAIKWLVAQNVLAVGTSGGEWVIRAGSAEQPLTPTNCQIKRQSNYGSGNVPALLVNDVLIYPQRLGRKVREMDYSFEKDRFISPDLTTYSEHITGSGLVQIAYQQQPFGILWGVTKDGTLVGLTHEKEQGVLGWHRHTTQGVFESVATIYGDEGQADEVWLVVRRNVLGLQKRYIERFNPNEWTEKEDAFFVDCGSTYDGAAATEILGLGYLEGKTVSILADGAVEPDQPVVNSRITLQYEASKVHVGLSYESILEPMKLDVDQTAGVSLGQTKQIRDIVVRFSNTLGCSVSDGTRKYNVSFRDTADFMDDSPPLFTGDKSIEFDGDWTTEARLILSQKQPLPFTVLGIVTKYQVTTK